MRQAEFHCPDVIVAMEGLKASVKNIQRRLKVWPGGTRIRVHFFRRDELMERDVVIQVPPQDTAWLELDGDADPETVARRSAWLGASD